MDGPVASDRAGPLSPMDGAKSGTWVLPDQGALARAAAERIATVARGAVAARGRFAVALSGGKTPVGTYRDLGSVFVSHIPWRQTEIFFTDERLVPKDHPDSNFRMIQEALLDHVPHSPENVHPMPTTELPSPECANAYEQDLRTSFGTGTATTAAASIAPPRFDLILLGVGPDGHTASIFPHTSAAAERERWVVATGPAPVAPAVRRVTLTLPVLNAAANVLFLASGKEKRGIVAQIFTKPSRDGPIEPVPAAAVRPRSGMLSWFIDEDAAFALPSDVSCRRRVGGA
ncbi:MAG: 6-phosphogluconolactonase [Thermoplasmatota archaeon]